MLARMERPKEARGRGRTDLQHVLELLQGVDELLAESVLFLPFQILGKAVMVFVPDSVGVGGAALGKVVEADSTGMGFVGMEEVGAEIEAGFGVVRVHAGASWG